MANKFEELLALIVQDENDRKVVQEVAGKYPELRDGWLRQSDYSRNMDTLKKDREAFDSEKGEVESLREYHDKQSKWYSENWVADAYGQGLGATKRELEKDKAIQELQQQISVGGEVTFEDLNKFLDTESEKRGWVSKDSFEKTLTDKESGMKTYLDNYMGNVSHMVTKAPQLAVRHLREFNEELDVEGLMKFAVENKHSNLEDAYSKQVEARRAEVAQKKREEELAAAKDEGAAEARKKLMEERMAEGNLPVDTGSPQMSHFQQFVQGVKPEEGKGNGRIVPDEVPFGRGAVAAYAARVKDRQDLERNAA